MTEGLHIGGGGAEEGCFHCPCSEKSKGEERKCVCVVFVLS